MPCGLQRVYILFKNNVVPATFFIVALLGLLPLGDSSVRMPP